MSAKKKYTGDTAFFEAKLARVMERLGVKKYQCDWQQGKTGASCWVEMCYGGRTYRFENDTAKSAAAKKNLTYVSDLLASVVYALERLALSVELGIFTLDMLLSGALALPETKPQLAPCFLAMGFAEMPKDTEEVKRQYKRMAAVTHPDHPGGSTEAFQVLQENYAACLAYFEEEKR